MKRIQRALKLGGFLGLLLILPLSRGQDSPSTTPLPVSNAPENNAALIAAKQEAEENYNSLRGHVEDLLAAQEDQRKQIQELRKQVEELRQRLSKPGADTVTPEDFKQLANAVQEIDRKRQADRDLILKEMEKLGHIVTEPPTRPVRNQVSNPPPSAGGNTGNANQNGYWYTIKSNDNISLIAKNYREQGIKITTQQILDANPNMNPSKLIIGQKIFIPDSKK